jgi:phosphoribosyl 1,2-cyclic phosphodiesterase
MISMIFLGTGGGRFATISQVRATGGLYLIADSARVHIDPGPGALIKLKDNGIDPTKTNAVIVTHCHPDHYTDAEVLIEAMTHGCKKKRGILVGSDSVLKGYETLGPAVSEYHASKPGDVKTVKPGDVVQIEGLTVKATRTFHSDPSAVGLYISSKDGVISMTGDTALKEEVFKDHLGADVLVLSVTRPLQARIPNHLSTEDAAAIVDAVKPKLAILTHFGMRFIGANPEIQANWVEKQTGVRTVAAWDGMDLVMKEKMPTVQRGLSKKQADGAKMSVDLDDYIQ